MSLKFRIVFSVACAVLVGILFLSYAQSVKAQAQAMRSEVLSKYGGEIAQVAVATNTIEAGKVIDSSDIQMRDWVAELVPQGAITDANSIIGKTLTVPICAGAPLSEFNFREAGSGIEVPKGMVAISIPLSDKIGISAATLPGTSVAAYATNDSGTSLISANVLILASGSKQQSQSSVLTLAVPVADVEKILSISATGQLRLVVPAEDVSSLPDKKKEAPDSVAACDVTEQQDSNAE
ncbi:MAG: Flp pilus assembly protein CpaB [Atopobium sp.]|uniref:Flp pilus assembly protein CpaB n=1 Tax=Atopobium sp. TaxID=1872650 RepID=UPI002A80C593|nr:Flp pilus assembly protein CpaB [Atopobium sp.]MDY4522095.1 Flp pilus assembly protein CpaB [Atopobium sp.]